MGLISRVSSRTYRFLKMGSVQTKAAKPMRQNLWNSRSTKSDWQYWFWKYKDFRIVLACMLYFGWDNPGRIRFFEWNKDQSEFTKKQEEYEKMKYFEKNRAKYYDSRDFFKPLHERREITKDQMQDQNYSHGWSRVTNIKFDHLASYKEATWKNREIAEGRHDMEVKKVMELDDDEVQLERVGKAGIREEGHEIDDKIK